MSTYFNLFSCRMTSLKVGEQTEKDNAWRRREQGVTKRLKAEGKERQKQMSYKKTAITSRHVMAGNKLPNISVAKTEKLFLQVFWKLPGFTQKTGIEVYGKQGLIIDKFFNMTQIDVLFSFFQTLVYHFPCSFMAILSFTLTSSK